jgi:hypothetical protein
VAAAEYPATLSTAADFAYDCWMEDNADGKRQTPAGWLEALERSQADLAAGRTVDGSVIMARLRQTLDDMERYSR